MFFFRGFVSFYFLLPCTFFYLLFPPVGQRGVFPSLSHPLLVRIWTRSTKTWYLLLTFFFVSIFFSRVSFFPHLESSGSCDFSDFFLVFNGSFWAYPPRIHGGPPSLFFGFWLSGGYLHQPTKLPQVYT